MSAAELRSLMERAGRSLRSRRNLIDDGDYDFALSRAYFAMFYAAKGRAALSGHQAIASLRHRCGIRPRPGKSRYLSDATSEDVSGGVEDHSMSNYQGVFPSREKSEARLSEASEFVAAVKKHLKEEGVQV